MYNVDFEGSCAALLGDRMLFLGSDQRNILLSSRAVATEVEIDGGREI